MLPARRQLAVADEVREVAGEGCRWALGVLREVRSREQVTPSLTPKLKDAMDVSNFDHCFTSDRSWKHSALLRTSAPGADESSLIRGEDPFANFHYVSRVSASQGALFVFGLLLLEIALLTCARIGLPAAAVPPVACFPLGRSRLVPHHHLAALDGPQHALCGGQGCACSGAAGGAGA